MTNKESTENIDQNTQMARAEEVLDRLPCINYPENYQPDYSANTDALLDAIIELHATEPVTTPRLVDQLQAELTKLARGERDTPMIITGGCAESVDAATPIAELVRQSFVRREVVIAAFGLQRVIGRRAATPIVVRRGELTKPRSSAEEKLSDGRIVSSYMGDAVNSRDPEHRTPDASRMISAALQERDLEAALTESTGEHGYVAHEALLLAYEHSFIRTDPDTGKKYSLSADLPWIGKRTNGTESEQVALLAEVANPIGIKIGPDSDATHIAALKEKLNPEGIPGKLIFMLRIGPKYGEELVTVVAAIKKHAPESLLMYDIHGVTRPGPNGAKIRYTGDIIDDIRATATACREAGLKLHGLHLETIADNSRLECVDEPDQLPTHPGGVDPQLNPRQTAYVLAETMDYLL